MAATQKVKVNREWLEAHVYNHEFEGKSRKEVIEDHDYIFDFEFEVKIKETKELYGVRVGIHDPRLFYKRLYITPTVGNYEFI